MSTNGIGNILGGITGGEQILEGIELLGTDVVHGVAKIIFGLGLFFMGYFIGKPI